MSRAQLHYGATAKAFHWTIVALLTVQIPLGWFMPDIHRGMSPGLAMSTHMTIGIVVLCLIVLRFLWRLTHPVAPESLLPAWQRVSSELVHWLLYLVVFLTTITGWSFASTRGWTIHLFGLIPLPLLPLGRAIASWHETLNWALLALIAVHIGAALVHLFVYRDRVMYRMLPG